VSFVSAYLHVEGVQEFLTIAISKKLPKSQNDPEEDEYTTTYLGFNVGFYE
jgi:hypothetical protein